MRHAETLRVYLPTPEHCALATESKAVRDLLVRHNQSRAEVRFAESPDLADVAILIEEFSFKQSDYAQRLQDDAFVSTHAHKLYTLNYDDTGQGFLPGCYVSLRRQNFDARIHRACTLPKTYNEWISPAAAKISDPPDALFSFCGTRLSHPVRRTIVDSLSGHAEGSVSTVDQELHTHTLEQKMAYAREILRSHFVLCPCGHSPSTYRLFEVMQLGRCPVIISDDWVPIAGVPWDECSIRVPESRVHEIPAILESRAADAPALGRKAAEIWSEHFSEQARYRSYVDMIADLHEYGTRGPARSIESLTQRWNSKSFRKGNGWTLSQKVMRKVLLRGR